MRYKVKVWYKGHKQDFTACCGDMQNALMGVTDSEGYAPLGYLGHDGKYDRLGVSFGSHPTPVKRCPWCGTHAEDIVLGELSNG